MFALAVVFAIASLAYTVWSPGEQVTDGRHDLRTNGIWMQHGWMGDDSWFERNDRDKTLFRDQARVHELAALLTDHGIEYAFVHVCPCDTDGSISPVDPDQTELFLDGMEGISVVPWIGGVLGRHALVESADWRAGFVASTVDLLQTHPRLAGVQVNIEPLPSGSPGFLTLLEDLRLAMPADDLLSVAAYPPPTVWQPSLDVHWDKAYFTEVALRVDQMAPMMYDTSIRNEKPYQNLMSRWTREVLAWSGDTQVLLGVPVYDDEGVGYHHPDVENLDNALLGIHAALDGLDPFPGNYAGIAIYCEWEMDAGEWEMLRREFGRQADP